jgi:hypothetical protein
MYSIDVCIKTNKPGIRTTVRAILLDKNDPKVNPYDYQLSEGLDEFGIMVLKAMIRFDSKDDRDEVLINAKGIEGVINACEDGSYVRPHLCGGDDAPCTIEEGGIYK